MKARKRNEFMRVIIYLEASTGVEVKVFDEQLTDIRQLDLLRDLTIKAYWLQEAIKKYAESLEEQ